MRRPAPSGKAQPVEVGIQQAFGAGWWRTSAISTSTPTTATWRAVRYPITFLLRGTIRDRCFTGRLNIVQHGGFSAFVVMAHTNAIFSPPGVGGILLEEAEGDFRIDHDQKFNSTTNLQYIFEKRMGAWAALSWRYDSGLVAGSVASLEDALGLSADQQAAIGFFCGSAHATRDSALTEAECTADNFGATRLRIPAEGTADDVENPPRVAPRHLFDLGIGWHEGREPRSVSVPT